MTPGYFHDAIHVAGLPIQMDGYNGSRPRCDGGLQRIRIHQHRIFLDINEDRPRSSECDRLGRGDERVGDSDDLIARTYAQAAKGEVERICTVADANTGFCLTVVCELCLECPELFAADEGAVNNRTLDRR